MKKPNTRYLISHGTCVYERRLEGTEIVEEILGRVIWLCIITACDECLFRVTLERTHPETGEHYVERRRMISFETGKAAKRWKLDGEWVHPAPPIKIVVGPVETV